MSTRRLSLSLFLVLLALFPAPHTSAAAEAGIPHLRQAGSATRLIVDGHPWILLAGELHNSSSSSVAYLEPIWPRLAALNLNTVIASLSWELVEPEEGKFDFSLADGIIEAARQHYLKLVFIWFATWKNGDGAYVPAWVKTNWTRWQAAHSAHDAGRERVRGDAGLARPWSTGRGGLRQTGPQRADGLDDFKSICAEYTQSGNPLFIPEASRDERAGLRAMYALGRHCALGFAPFGIDSFSETNGLRDYYDVLGRLLPLIAQHQGKETLKGFLQYGDEKRVEFDLGDFRADIEYRSEDGNRPGGGLVIAVAPDTFVMAGANYSIRFPSGRDKPGNTAWLAIEELVPPEW